MSELESSKLVENLVKIVGKNMKAILIGLAVIFGGLFVLIFIGQQNKKQEKLGYAAYYTIEKKLTDKKEAVYKRQEEAQKDIKNKKDLKIGPGDLDADYGKNIAEYKIFISENKSKQASVLAAMELAALYDIFSKPQDALEALLLVDQNILKPGQLLFGLYHIQLGRSYLSVEKYDLAQNHLDKVIADKGAIQLHGAAYLKKGVVFYKTNKLDQAKETFTRVSEQFSESESAQLAKTYLKIINI